MFESVTNLTCAVIGKPIAHSLSPHIHQLFAAQFGMSIDYLRLSCEPAEFNQVVSSFFAAGGRGMNVTTPFKEQAHDLASVVSNESQVAQSCNTLYFNDGALHGTTTDGEGWLRDIQRLNINLADSRILLLGVGGASRIILGRLLAMNSHDGPERIVLANRTVSKIQPLLTDDRLAGAGLDEIPLERYDLIINGLPIGWQDNFPALNSDLANSAQGYDLNYGKGAESFRRWFNHPERCHDGWGMLVNQAALSFEIWWQEAPATEHIIEMGPEAVQASSS